LLVLLGRSSEALEHIEKGSELYAAHHNHRYSAFGNFDSKVMFDCFAAMALLELGYPDKSEERLFAGLRLARELAHSQTLVTALHVTAQLRQLRGEVSLAYEAAKEALELADEYGFALWRTYGLIELGWATAELGNPDDGIEKMQRGITEYELAGAKLRSPYFFQLLADQLGKVGRAGEAIKLLTKAIALAETIGEGYALPGLYRAKGELLSKDLLKTDAHAGDSSTGSALPEARRCFAQALAIAKQQGTRFWQLRAASSIHLLDLRIGTSPSTQLAEIYSSFTEGHESVELKRAKALLDSTSPLNSWAESAVYGEGRSHS